MSRQAGFRGKLYLADINIDEATQEATGYTLTDTEIKIVRDVTLDLSTDQIDVSDRDNNGYKAYIAGLKDGQFSTTVTLNPQSAAFKTLLDAWNSGEPIGLGVLFRDKANTADNWGVVGLWVVTGFNVSQPLTDGQTVDISASINKFAGWFPQAAPPPEG